MLAEQICKATQLILRSELEPEIEALASRWAEAQVFEQITLPAEPSATHHETILPSDIMIGSVDVVQAESNFPAIYIWIEECTAEFTGEQLFAGFEFALSVRVIVNGVTIEESQRKVFRCAQAIQNVLGRWPTLGGVVSNCYLQRIRYGVSPDDPLFRAAQLEYRLSTLESYEQR